jgi:predicted nuclease of predicted toxin-antitoxin system
MPALLIDASLPRSTVDLIRSLGHDATDVRNIGLGAASDESVAVKAREARLCLLTRDQDFGNIANYPPERHFGIVVFRPPDAASRSLVLSLVEPFVRTNEIVNHISGRLTVVEPHRLRVRPALD